MNTSTHAFKTHAYAHMTRCTVLSLQTLRVEEFFSHIDIIPFSLLKAYSVFSIKVNEDFCSTSPSGLGCFLAILLLFWCFWWRRLGKSGDIEQEEFTSSVASKPEVNAVNGRAEVLTFSKI